MNQVMLADEYIPN